VASGEANIFFRGMRLSELGPVEYSVFQVGGSKPEVVFVAYLFVKYLVH